MNREKRKHNREELMSFVGNTAAGMTLMALGAGVLLGIGWGVIITAFVATPDAPITKMICGRE